MMSPNPLVNVQWEQSSMPIAANARRTRDIIVATSKALLYRPDSPYPQRDAFKKIA
jgi:hypothetical protein